MAWLTGWSYRKKLTLDSSKVDSDCSDFPVKVIFDEDSFAFAHALETGNDIRFTSSDGETLLKHEREIHEIIDWGKFAGTVDGTYDTYSDANADYLALRFHRLGAMNKYAELDNSIDASSDFVFSFKIYVTGIVMGALPTAGCRGCIGLSENTTNAKNHYVGADIVYDADTSTKAYVSSRFEGTSPNESTGFAYSDGIELNTETTYIIKLSKTGSTLKVAVCNASDEELWSDTATASTTPTLTYLKIWDYTPGSGSPYVDFRLSDFYNGSTEETFQLKAAVYHVKIPTASSTSDTEFYCYYGKSDATDGADGENVWDSNYALVHHMGADCLDSTSNDNDGTNSGSTLGLAGDGYYRSFDGTNDYINITGIPALPAYTMEAYYSFPSKFSSEREILAIRSNNMVILGSKHDLYTDDGIGAYHYDGTARRLYVDGLSVNTKYLISTSFGSGTQILYSDGALVDSASSINQSNDMNQSDSIGSLNNSSAYWSGNIYEVRISSAVRSAAWIKATSHSLANTLISFGSEESLTPTAKPRVMVVWA